MGIDLYMTNAKGDHVAGNRFFPSLMGWSMVKGDNVSTDCIRGNQVTRMVDLHCGIDIREMDDDQHSRMVSNETLHDIVNMMQECIILNMVESLVNERWNHEDAITMLFELKAWFRHHANLGHHMRVTR